MRALESIAIHGTTLLAGDGADSAATSNWWEYSYIKNSEVLSSSRHSNGKGANYQLGDGSARPFHKSSITGSGQFSLYWLRTQ